MTGKKLAAGWVVQLTLRQLKQDVEPDTRAPTFQFFNVAISSPDKAIEAARKKPAPRQMLQCASCVNSRIKR